MLFQRLIIVICIVQASIGLADWLTGSISRSDNPGAIDDFGASAWFTVAFFEGLLISVLALSFVKMKFSGLAQKAMMFLYILFTVLTLNSGGAWLWPSALLLIAAFFFSPSDSSNQAKA